MAADSVLGISNLPLTAAAASCGPAATGAPAMSPSPAASDSQGGAGALGTPPGSSQQTSQSPAGGCGQTAGSAPGGADAPGSSASGEPGASGRNGSGAESRAARRAAGASGSSSTSSPNASARAAGGEDGFSAALAQSLAATPADRPAPTHTPAPAGAESSPDSAGKDHSGARSTKHSGPDPVSTALMLLEHSLAGVLAGVPSSAAAGTSAAGTSGIASAPGARSGAAARSTAVALETRLALNVGSDAKAAASAPPATSGAPTAAASATAAGAATAALLTAGSQFALQQPKSAPTPAPLTSPVGSSAWTDELGTRLTWMAHQGIQSASLQLSPEHLGPLQVSISIHNGQASVWFGAAQPDTRTALQQSLPQLRQLFANQGLTLADAGVSRESPRGQTHQGPARTASGVTAVAAASSDGSGGRVLTVGGLGLVDTYV
jgi:flagellar hook-length control protein FliK